MKIVREISLKDFEFWAGAKDTVSWLTSNDLDIIENYLCEISDELEETLVNDLFWFSTDFIADCLGYEDWDALTEDRK